MLKQMVIKELGNEVLLNIKISVTRKSLAVVPGQSIPSFVLPEKFI